MKTLVIPIDFSTCSIDAYDTLLSLNETLGYTVTLIHVANEDSEIAEAKKKLEELARPYKDAFTFDLIVKSGSFYDIVKDFTDKHEVAFIGMGSHGYSGRVDPYLGSNTQKLIRRLNAPIMIIRERKVPFQINRVVFASDFNQEERAVFQVFLDFIRPFKPEIHLVHIHTSTLFDGPVYINKAAMDDFKAMSREMKCFVHLVTDDNPEQGIRKMSTSLEADLIGISNHEKNWLKRIFVTSTVEALVNFSQVPVYSIDYLVNEKS